MTDAARSTPVKPYFLRALYDWCTDNGHTPYLSVRADDHCRIPRAHVKDGHITLNIGALASHNLDIGNDFIEFQARFNGVAQNVSVPVAAVTALYARETGEGMGFEAESVDVGAAPEPATVEPEKPASPEPARPRFQLVK